MLVLFIILGIMIGLPVYLFVGKWVLNILGNALVVASAALLCGLKEAEAEKVNWRDFCDGCVDYEVKKIAYPIMWPIVITACLVIFKIAVLYRILWLVWQGLKFWGRVVRACFK